MSRLPFVLLIVSVAACGIDKEVHQKALSDLAACQRQLDTCQKSAAATAEELKEGIDAEAEARKKAEATLSSTERDLEATSAELEELRKQRAATEKRLAAYRDLNDKLKQLVDTGKLTVGFRKGQMVIELPSEILFSSGQAKLSKKGKDALRSVTDVLATFKDRRFLVAGHTDNQKIRTPRFPNNWHLSTARAVSVVEFFIDEGFPPENLGAAGYGEFDPVAENDSKENRQLNRRIEIILVPDLSELPKLAEEPKP